MSYWVVAKVRNLSEAMAADSLQDAAREARRLAEGGAEGLKIIGPDLQTLSLEEIERQLHASRAHANPG